MKATETARPSPPTLLAPDGLSVLIAWVGRWSLVEASIGVAWQECLSAALRLQVSWEQNVLVFLGLWLGYSADHYLDAARLPQDVELAPRHLLHRTEPRRSGYLMLAALGLATLIAAVRLQPEQQAACGCVVLLACGYLGLSHWNKTRALFRRELAAALIYPAGVGTFIWPRLPTLPPAQIGCLVLAVGAFCGLVLANLGIISHVEAPQDRACGEDSLAQRHPKSRHLLAPGCAVGATTALLFSLGFQDNWQPFWLTVSSSAAFLMVIATRLNRFAPERAHGLVDAALLCPPLLPLIS